MSILLEALRKTEKQKRPAPTIHDEAPAEAAPGPVLTWPVVVMLVVALSVSGWAAWRQYHLPEGLYRPPVTLASGQVSRAEPQPEANAVKEVAAAGADVPQTASQPQKPLSATLSRQQRTPVETYQASVSTTSGAAPDVSATTTESPFSSARSAGSDTAAAETGVGLAAAPAALSAETAQKPTHVPEPIGYWELPDAVRANVPEIKFSVLVYDENPAGRFALVGGERLGEGDDLQPGLKVEEIRRDGIVFSYRLYRFLVKR